MKKIWLKDALEMAALLGRWRRQETTPEENQAISQWAKEPANRKLLAELSDSENMLRTLDEIERYNGSEAWRKVQQELDGTPARGRVRRMLSLAAAGLALLVISGLLFLFNSNRELAVSQIDIAGGSAKARLYYSGDHSIPLQAADSGSVPTGSTYSTNANGLLSLPRDTVGEKFLELCTLEVPAGGTYQVRLSDGTHVWLNAGSKLLFPVRFAREMRYVTLVGEGYFEVAKDSRRPFFVETRNTEVKVVGTAFNINSYRDTVLTTLFEGKAVVRTAGFRQKLDSVVLTPGLVAVHHGDGRMHAARADLLAASAWRDGKFLYRDARLAEVLTDISRWYDVEIRYLPGVDPNATFRAETSRDLPLRTLLEMMEQTGIARFRFQQPRTLLVLPYEATP